MVAMKIRAFGYKNKMLTISSTVLTLIAILEIGDGYQSRTHGGKENKVKIQNDFQSYCVIL